MKTATPIRTTTPGPTPFIPIPARYRVPLDAFDIRGESISQYQPGPGDLRPGKITVLSGNPEGSQENIGQHAAEMLFRQAEQRPDQRHLEGIGHHGENAATHVGVAYPEGRDGIPEHEAAIVAPPEMAVLHRACQLVGHQQRKQCHQQHIPRMRQQPRNA